MSSTKSFNWLPIASKRTVCHAFVSGVKATEVLTWRARHDDLDLRRAGDLRVVVVRRVRIARHEPIPPARPEVHQPRVRRDALFVPVDPSIAKDAVAAMSDCRRNGEPAELHVPPKVVQPVVLPPLKFMERRRPHHGDPSIRQVAARRLELIEFLLLPRASRGNVHRRPRRPERGGGKRDRRCHAVHDDLSRARRAPERETDGALSCHRFRRRRR